ncbi:MAG TPA: hypothetical protein VLB27_02315, partial [candidate division Zixibacteria bacterium]|nr:hypothetical protein [candidate division Zixibacteria bacterium]
MNSPDQQYLQRFEILRQIALDGAAGGDLATSVRAALAASAELLGLTAARVILWDDDRKIILNVTHAPGEREGAALDELEEDIFADLRRSRRLRS